MRKVSWGVLGVSKMAVDRTIPAMQLGALSSIDAIASRDEARAKACAKQLGIAKAYGSYEALLADPQIEAVYNPLPNNLHVAWTEKALAAGKHVLCEKPIAMTAKEAERLADAQRRSGRVVMEAFMVRMSPQWLKVREIVESGRIGAVQAVSGVVTYNNPDPANIRNILDVGGGGIMDIGCYPVVGARFLFGAEPKRVVSLVERDPNFKTDRLAGALADFGNGRQLVFTCSTQLVPFQTVQALGTKGRLEIIIPFNAPQGQATTILIDDGSAIDRSSARRESLPASDQYTEQAENFALAVLGQKSLPYGIEDSIQNMRILDALFQSERSGAWVAL